MSTYRYPWPASAITPDDMQQLHAVREASPNSIPITQLIAEAVRYVYGTSKQSGSIESHETTPQREAA